MQAWILFCSKVNITVILNINLEGGGESGSLVPHVLSRNEAPIPETLSSKYGKATN